MSVIYHRYPLTNNQGNTKNNRFGLLSLRKEMTGGFFFE